MGYKNVSLYPTHTPHDLFLNLHIHSTLNSSVEKQDIFMIDRHDIYVCLKNLDVHAPQTVI